MDQKILLIIIIIFLLSNNIFKVVKSVCLNFFYLIILLTIINFINPDIYKIIKKNLTLIINGETDYYNFVFKYSANKIKKFLLSFIYNDYDDAKIYKYTADFYVFNIIMVAGLIPFAFSPLIFHIYNHLDMANSVLHQNKYEEDEI